MHDADTLKLVLRRSVFFNIYIYVFMKYVDHGFVITFCVIKINHEAPRRLYEDIKILSPMISRQNILITLPRFINPCLSIYIIVLERFLHEF